MNILYNWHQINFEKDVFRNVFKESLGNGVPETKNEKSEGNNKETNIYNQEKSENLVAENSSAGEALEDIFEAVDASEMIPANIEKQMNEPGDLVIDSQSNTAYLLTTKNEIMKLNPLRELYFLYAGAGVADVHPEAMDKFEESYKRKLDGDFDGARNITKQLSTSFEIRSELPIEEQVRLNEDGERIRNFRGIMIGKNGELMKGMAGNWVEMKYTEQVYSYLNKNLGLTNFKFEYDELNENKMFMPEIARRILRDDIINSLPTDPVKRMSELSKRRSVDDIDPDKLRVFVSRAQKSLLKSNNVSDFVAMRSQEFNNLIPPNQENLLPNENGKYEIKYFEKEYKYFVAGSSEPYITQDQAESFLAKSKRAGEKVKVAHVAVEKTMEITAAEYQLYKQGLQLRNKSV